MEYLRWKEIMSKNVMNRYIHNALTQWVSIHIKLTVEISIANLMREKVFLNISASY